MTSRVRLASPAVLLMVALACSGGAPRPAALDAKNDTCSICRMIVSDQRLAAQIVVSGEEPRFFDDLGCLAKFLDGHQGPGQTVYVADHRTGEWTPAADAVYSHLARGSTPMASGLIAHASAQSRAQDQGAAGSVLVDAAEVIGRTASRGRSPS